MSSWARPERRMGIPGYARLLRTVVEPMTAAEAAEAVKVKSTTVARLLREFHRFGLVHVIGWVRAGKPRSPFVPVYSAGRGDDAPVPTSIRSAKTTPRPLCLEFCRVTSMVMDGPVTTADLSEEAGIDMWDAQRFLSVLRSVGLLYVARWDVSGHKPVRAWGWGPGKHSAKRPKSNAQREWRRRRDDLRILAALRGQGCGTKVAAKVAGATMERRAA